MKKLLNQYLYWIFDMDGTITKAIHDFPKIKTALGLPSDKPILETLETLSKREAKRILEKLTVIELELARCSQPQTGAVELLEELKKTKKQCGILTRNSVGNAYVTLKACKLDVFFSTGAIVGRDSCRPKPKPDGIIKLMSEWQAKPGETVIVGDYLFDLLAGRKAGIMTIYFDPTAKFEFAQHADFCIDSLITLSHCLST